MPQRRRIYIIWAMGADDASQPLINDPARDASAPMRGYSAQIWRSVLAWMELGESERLYLEGAEDIDRVSGLTAETIQVKDVAGNVTLRSTDVVDAIDNFWAHQDRNPRHVIQFRFLTTAGIGIEQGAPFGRGIGGLHLWRGSRSSSDVPQREHDARVITDFLLSEAKLSGAVLGFLRRASDTEIWQKVIAPIEWDTDAEGAPGVVSQIKERLVNLGHLHGVAPDQAKDVAEHLFAIAFETATRRDDRHLTRAMLLEALYKRTHVSLPSAAANALLGAISHVLMPPGGTPLAVSGRGRIIGRPRPLPSRYYARGAMLADIGKRFAAHPVLVLQGGTGVGKSIAAAGHAAKSSASWGWVELRGLERDGLADMLDRVVTALAAEDGVTHVVLDDIELPADSRPLETRLARIKSILGDRGGHLLITSAGVLPQRLSLLLELPESGTMRIPAFSRGEIKEFLVTRGCPSTQVAEWLAAFVELHSSGHAQLVHARIATLEAQGFPKPEMLNVMATPPDVVEARAEARRLISTLDRPTRELIYRLSLTPHALPQRQVLAIAGQPPAIPEPGLEFQRLVGPWLEMVGEGRYRISPLLIGVGTEVQGEDWATAMHGTIARTMLGLRTLSTTDVSSILLHATLGRDWAAIARLSFGIVRSDHEVWEALAVSAKWFVYVGIDIPARPQTSPASLFLMRLMQFRLAAAAKDDDAATGVIACLNEELPTDVTGMPLRLARHLFLAQVLLQTGVNLPLAQLVAMGLEFTRLGDELKEVLAGTGDPRSADPLIGPDGTSDMAAVVGFRLMSTLTDRSSLAHLLDAFEQIEPATVRRLLWFIGGRESTSLLACDRVWLAEFNSTAPDWTACREVILRVYAFARRCELPGLAQAAVRVIARIVDENLGDPAKALQLMDAMTAEIGRSPGQDDQRATILMRNGDLSDALEIWRELLPRWKPRDQFDMQPSFSRRLAAVAAGRLNEWKEAAEWLQHARALANDGVEATRSAALWIDEGYARWKSGDNRAALDCLIEGLAAIDKLPSDDSDQNAFLLRKRAGHTVMWIASIAANRAPKEFSPPGPAWCSGFEPLNGKASPTPSDAMWAHAVEFEFVAGLGDEQFRACEARLKASHYGPIRLTFSILRLDRRLRSLALNDFVEVVGDFVESFELCKLYYAGNGLSSNDMLPTDLKAVDRKDFNVELVLSTMMNAVFALAARGTATRAVVDHWVASAARAGLSEIVVPWLEFVTALFVHNTLHAGEAVRDQSLPWPWQITASIRVATDTTIEPTELLAIHDLWASVLPKAASGLHVVGDVEHLVTGGWRRHAKNRFLLRSPYITAPALLQACDGASTGWKKIGEVLSAACNAVPAAVPQVVRERLLELAARDHS